MRKTKVQTFLDPAAVNFLHAMIKQGYATNMSEALRKCVIVASVVLDTLGVVRHE